MRNIFNILAFISAIVLITTILLQSRGAGLSATFGGEGNVYRTKRGAERVVYNTTIIAAVVMVLSLILGIMTQR